MENTTDLFYTTSIEDDPLSIDWILTLVMLGAVCVIGTVGNLLVLGVYLQHYLQPHLRHRGRHIYRIQLSRSDQETTKTSSDHDSNDELFTKSTGTPTFFILVLASVDLLVCCFVVPLTFYMEYVNLRPGSDFFCKAHSFMAVCNTMFSSLVVIAIALDRYLAICHPFHHILTMKRAKILTLCLAIFCVIYGFLGSATIMLAESKTNPGVKECTDTVQLPNATKAVKCFYIIVQKGNTASFVLAILCVLVLYSLILQVVLRTHRNLRDTNLGRTDNQTASDISGRLTPAFVQDSLNNAQNGNGLGDMKQRKSSRLVRVRMRWSIRNLTESTLWREVRSASVLFVVAVVYIIVFTPSLLAANQLACMTLLGYNSYFLNNMSNPLIYCFMSKTFRKKLKILLCGVCLERAAASKDRMVIQPRGRPRQRVQINGQIRSTEIAE